MKPVIFLCVFVLLGYGIVGVITSAQAHGGSTYWLLGGAIAVAFACATIITMTTMGAAEKCPHKHTKLVKQVVKTLQNFNHKNPTIEPNGSEDTMLYIKKWFHCEDCGGTKTFTYRA